MSNASKQDYNIIQNDEIDLKALWMVLWTNKLTLVKITSGFVVLAIFYLFFATRLYYSNSSIIQTEGESGGSMNSIVSIASSVGMDVGETSEATTVNIVDFVASRRLRDNILEKKWLTKKQDEIDLISYWGIGDSSGIGYALKSGIKSLLNSVPKTEEEARLKQFAEGRKILEKRVIARHTETSLIVVEVWMEDPQIARDLTSFVIDDMVKYTKKIKADKWKNNREFLVQRMEDVKVELEQAEDNMTEFQKDNRRVMDSPELLIELANLKRDVEIKTQLYMTLQNEFEYARLEEAKDVSGIVVLDNAFYPVEIYSPKIRMVLILSIFLGAILSVPGYLLYRGIKQ